MIDRSRFKKPSIITDGKVMMQRSLIVPFMLFFLVSISISPAPVNASPLPPYPLTQTHPKNDGSNPYGLFEYHGEVYFGTQQNGFWKTDGTESGTLRLNYYYPADTYQRSPGDIYRLYKDYLYFNMGALWKTTGEQADPVQVFPYPVSIRKTAELNGDLYFIPSLESSTLDYPYGLWKTDGTLGSAQVVFEGANNFAGDLISFNNHLFFTGYGPEGYALWTSDGTTAGTRILKPILPASAWYGDHLVVFQNKLFFSAMDAANHWQLYSTDGTEENTIPISVDICEDTLAASRPKSLTVVNDRLYFTKVGCDNFQHLYAYDGTAAGAVQISSPTWRTAPFDLLAVGDTLYFFASAGYPTTKLLLWKAGGTPVETTAIKEAGIEDWSENPTRYLTEYNGKLYFAHDISYAPINGPFTDFWSSDGTTDGTGLFNSLSPSRMYVVGGILYFVGDNNYDGKELWKTDGTNQGTWMVKNIVDRLPEDPLIWSKAGNQLFFYPDGGGGLWTTDGTPENTHLIPEVKFCSKYRWINARDGHQSGNWRVAYYAGADCQLWRTDGTPSGTFRLSQGIVPNPDSGILELTQFKSRLVFLSGNEVTIEWPANYDLWGSDGSPAGTSKLLPLGEAGAGMKYIAPVVFQDAVYFFAIYASNADRNIRWAKFWRTDGTVEGTQVLFDSRTYPGYSGLPERLIVSGSHLFFTNRLVDTMLQVLWQSDGTLAGTQVVAPIGNGQISDMVDASGTLYLINVSWIPQPGNGFIDVPILYKTKGKEAGGIETVHTMALVDFGSRSLTAAGSHVFFRDYAEDNMPPRLWVSDGTQNGTHPVMVNNGLTIPASLQLEPVGNEVAFVGYEFLTDHEEIWLSDGSETGSHPLTSLSDGDYQKKFGQIEFVDGKIFFSFTDGLKGYQMWVLPYLTEKIYLPSIRK